MALNGKRKYYSVYHAAAELIRSRRNPFRSMDGKSAAASLGMDEDSDSSWETEVRVVFILSEKGF